MTATATATAIGAATGSSRRVVVSNRCRQHDFRVIESPREFLNSDLFIDKEGLGPGLSAIGASIDAAIFRLLANIALSRDHDKVGIVGIDQNTRDLFGRFEAKVSPSFAGVDRFVNSVAFVDSAPSNEVTHADINNVWIRWSDLDRTN